MSDSNAIKVEDLSKKYVLGDIAKGSVKDSISSIFKGSKKATKEFWALKNVSFDLTKGEVLGVVGRNGAGKSTLLKILSRITSPTEGRIEINGRVSSLLEVGTGFHPELSGRENIFLNGTILGMSRKEIKSKFDEIVAFSEVEKFLDTPVKRYSSGMYVRLAFAVAAHLEPEILIVDEVLAVGDAQFQKKCLGKMQDVAKQGRTVIFVSHNMNSIQNLCTKGLFLNQGQVVEIADTNTIINSYMKSVRGAHGSTSSVFETSNTYPVQIKNVYLRKGSNEAETSFKIGESLEICCELQHNDPEIDYQLVLGINDQNGTRITTFMNFETLSSSEASCTVTARTNNLVLRSGNYDLSVSLRKQDNGECIQQVEFISPFEIINLFDPSVSELPKELGGFVTWMDVNWEITKENDANI